MFEGSLLKIERAKKHINDLNSDIVAYLGEKPFEMVIKQQAMQDTWTIKTKKPIPLDFSVILGDAIHNLRASLDLLVFDMVGSKAKCPEKVYFPFCKSAAGYVSAISGNEIQLAGKKVVAAFNTFKPYPNGDESLYGIHLLDIADKHRLIVTTGMASNLSADDIKRINKNIPLFGPGVIRSTSGEQLIVKHKFANRTMTRQARKDKSISYEKPYIQPAFQICFGNGQPFAGRSVIEQMTASAIRVTEVTTAIIEAYNS